MLFIVSLQWLFLTPSLILGKIDLNTNLLELEIIMSNILEQQERLRVELQEKWLNYYQANRVWLEQLNGHGYRINNPWFILGIITALETKSELKELLQYFLLVTKDCNSIIRALGLDFDPELELKKRSQQTTQQQTETDSQYLDRVREEIET